MKHAFCSFLAWAPLALAVLCFGCSGDDTPPVMRTNCGVPPQVRWSHHDLGATVGVVRSPFLSLSRDYCEAPTIDLSSSDPSVATIASSVSIALGSSRVRVPITAVAVGTTTITASWTVQDVVRTVSLAFDVVDAALPACAGSAAGTLAYGTTVTVATGTITGASITLPEGAARPDRWHAEPFDAQIACAADQVPAGFRALGPAVRFGPDHLRFMRELPMTLPLRLGLLPERAHRGHVEVSYTGPGAPTPRIVPVAVQALIGGGDALLTFEAPRLGTYQAVVRDGAGSTRMRNFTFRGIAGFSMGGAGAAVIGYSHPDRFDFVAPMGTAWDWVYMQDYMHNYHLGGFCTEVERVADPVGCAGPASVDRTPPASHVNEHRQDFEHWWFEDDKDGQGGTFDRDNYINLFSDLAVMYGNTNTDRTTDPAEPNITPPGVPDSERLRTRSVRCMNPLPPIPPFDGSPGTGFFDDEYNPTGSYQVITFCDGGELVTASGVDHGIWDPAADQRRPIDMLLAVDVNANGVRDPGEPVIRNGHEPFEDCGLDRLCNAAEPGFDAVTNPDPNGDDYDYQYNTIGTERNFLHDGDPCDLVAAEVFTDVGLDGVPGTAQLAAGGFDNGEGNGCFDRAAGSQRMIDRGPRHLVLNSTDAQLDDIDVFSDGGIRDLFLAGVACNHSIGAFVTRNRSVRYHNGHATLHLDGRRFAEDFVSSEVNWDEIGQRVLVRYGDPDASPALVQQGDGQHAGSNDQMFSRIMSSIMWMNTRWPDGDRRIVRDSICSNTPPGCANPNQILTDYTSPTTGRTGQVTIILPPGYFDAAFADVRYPVVYLLHGYGMQPEDLRALSFPMWNFMTARNIPTAERVQKLIFVIPDGFCRAGECVKGTFYADAPPGTPGGAQMSTYMLDLMDHVDAIYRTRAAEAFEVVN